MKAAKQILYIGRTELMKSSLLTRFFFNRECNPKIVLEVNGQQFCFLCMWNIRGLGIFIRPTNFNGEKMLQIVHTCGCYCCFYCLCKSTRNLWSEIDLVRIHRRRRKKILKGSIDHPLTNSRLKYKSNNDSDMQWLRYRWIPCNCEGGVL